MKRRGNEARSHRNRFLAMLMLLVIGLTGCRTTDGDRNGSSGKATGWDDVPEILARIIPPTFPDRTFSILD